MNISWGKCKIFAKDLDAENASYIVLPTPVEDSTQLTTQEGDKMEAPVEGGENEDSRKKKAKYSLALEIRVAKGRQQPIADDDGVVEHHYEIILQPEDKTCPGFKIAKASVSCASNFTAAKGGSWSYTFDSLKPESGKQLVWGTVADPAQEGGAPTFTPLS